MPLRLSLPSPLAAVVLACGALALAFALAPPAHAHLLSYDDPLESDAAAVGLGDDILQTTVNHWTESGPYLQRRAPVTVEHTVRTTPPTNGGAVPRLHIVVGSTHYEVYRSQVTRSDGTVTGSAQHHHSGSTWTYRFPLSAIGNPSSYEWRATARMCLQWLHYATPGGVDAVCLYWRPQDTAPDNGHYTHVVRYGDLVARASSSAL